MPESVNVGQQANPRDTAAPCPTCSPPHRETVGMVCQTCGTDYGANLIQGSAPKVDIQGDVQPSSAAPAPIPERFRSTSGPGTPFSAGLPYGQQPQGIDPAFPAPIAYPPVKCPDCGTWWRTATHKCVSTGATSAT